jgi:hypothetical protein
MNMFRNPHADRALRFMVNKLHLPSVSSCAPKICSLLLVMVFGLTQAVMPSVAKAPRRARLVFFGSKKVFESPDKSFGEPSGIGTTTGKCIRRTPEGDTLYSWQFPETIGPAGAKFQIGVAARAKEKGSGISAVIGLVGTPVQETNLPRDISVAAKPNEGLKQAVQTFTFVPQPAYESKVVQLQIRCHGGFDVVFYYQVEQ